MAPDTVAAVPPQKLIAFTSELVRWSVKLIPNDLARMYRRYLHPHTQGIALERPLNDPVYHQPETLDHRTFQDIQNRPFKSEEFTGSKG